MCAHGEKRGRKKEYVAYLTVRAGRGFVTVVVRRSGPWLVARLGYAGSGSCPEVSKFGPWPAWVNILKSLLGAPGIVQVEGETYPLRTLLASLGYWFDRVAGVYRRAPELEVRVEEPADFYAELGF